VTIDTTSPLVSSINRVGSTPTNAATVQWTVAFTDNVFGVDATDFTLVGAGASGASITTVTGSGTTWTVTDRCDGTLTSVTTGTVVVRDFRKKRNVTVRARRSYLARAG
jgi:hypothetical protein